MLRIKNLRVSIEGRAILKGVDLEIKAGEVHAIMGQNGSGKTTLARVLAGADQRCEIRGRVSFLGRNLLAMQPEDRARAGIFMAFQNPVEIPGVSLASFLNSCVNEIRKFRNELPLDAMDFSIMLKEKVRALDMKEEFLLRGVNEGFSGGERKKNEIFQMAVLEPKFIILDEIDSGLDVDSLKKTAQAINAAKKKDRAFMVITHYQRILDYIAPDFVHVMLDGKIIRSGGPELALEVEKHGYQNLS